MRQVGMKGAIPRHTCLSLCDVPAWNHEEESECLET